MLDRKNPIPETIEHVSGYPNTLIIYKCQRSRFYQARAHVGRLVTRSLRTDVRGQAITRAKDFYQELIGRKARGEPVTENKANFAMVAEALFKEDQTRVDRGERKQSLVDDSKYIYEADLKGFFGSKHVKNINYELLNEYIAHLRKAREEAGKEPIKSKTLKNHFIVMSKILKHAHKLALIDKLPIFPTISQQDNPREWFTEPQYTRLMTSVDKLIEEKRVVRFHTVTKELKLLVSFLVNSFLRPADLKNLKHKHIERVTQGKHSYLRILAMAKTKVAPVISMEACVAVYAELKKFNAGHDKDEDFILWPQLVNRGYAMETMRRQFNEALTVSELKLGPGGQPRTLYSLRHTCIMRRLLNAKNIDLLTLARNCRTSVEMIQRFYASHLTAEMNVDKLLTDDVIVIDQGSNLEALLTEANDE
jgi:integrase